jgi:20S proteasome alpha/beta subunit
LTCIIGLVCKDGVLIASDRRIVRGPEALEERKIHELKIGEDVVGVVAASGLTGMRDNFLEESALEIAARRIVNVRELKESMEDAAYRIYTRYSERLKEDAEINALVACLENLSSGKAKLYQLYSNGYMDEIKTYSSLGSSTPLTLPFLKAAYHDNLTLEQATRLSIFIIMYIQRFELDRNVGGKPMIALVKNGEGVKILGEEEIDKLVNEIKSLLETYKNELLNLLNLKPSM